MAFRATSYWRSMLSRLGGNRSFATSTAPKMKPFAPTAGFARAHGTKPRAAIKGEFVPVYVALGLIVLSLSIGAHTAKQQLLYCPSVRVNKKRRETLPEVVEPDHVVEEADKFITKSFFRKVAHIQEFDHDPAISDPIRGDVFAMPIKAKAETLKSVGVDPSHL
ncbi:hypothetical protein HHK36_025297 [Tetracentron sinense]|uniref:Uncharacterized protein n=1 Tax=Tetracentron sinense TaxID=13715 RepID=A0A835D8C5_TETSI|nr:hypothetical protein HHK36_025297 [Tetracentron sinense]